MAVENLKEKLAQIVSNEPSKWLEEAKWRRENRSWLKRSQAVAIKVLSTLRERGLSQKDLAEKLSVSPQQVNKWLKGKENFTFETVSKIEDALTIQLMSITGFETKQESSVQIKEVKYPQRGSYTPSEIRRKPTQTRHISFVSSKVPLKDFNKAM
ncbi:MAG: helix-turn-helix transcriptional regulator [Paludibacter sp.]